MTANRTQSVTVTIEAHAFLVTITAVKNPVLLSVQHDMKTPWKENKPDLKGDFVSSISSQIPVPVLSEPDRAH